MNKKDAQLRVAELTKQLHYHSHRYYVLDDPEISDFDCDAMLRELETLEEEFPELRSDNSPTVRVGGQASNSFEKVAHAVQMGSLQDAFSDEEMLDFFRRVEEKIDHPV